MKAILFILGILVSSVSIGQNTTMFSQINFAQGVNNPAAIAFDGKIMADLIFRNQWFGIQGAPTTIALNGQYEIDQNMAVGINMFHDKIGVQQTSSFAGQFSYRVQLDGSRIFSLGLGLGANYHESRLAGAHTTQAGDPVFSQSYFNMFFNGAFGVFYNSPKFYIGASIPQLFQDTKRGAEKGFQPPRWHYYLSTGFYIEASENYTFNPHLQVKASINTPIQADLILRNTFMNRFSVNVGYRSESSIIAGFDILLAEFARVGYSFNYDIGPLSRVKGASNELYLGIALPYHSDRYRFDSRKYISSSGGHKSDFRKNSGRKQRKSGQRYGRNSKFR